MCLIMYSPEGQLPPQQVWSDAAQDNPDGIGVMSERAIVKWTGKKGYAKAWRHVKKLNKAGIPFAVHFRWRTHGAQSTDQCHPHQTALGSYVMHNGVLGPTSHYATADDSDTALYVKWYLYAIAEWQSVRPLVEGHIGEGNKFVIMDERKEFHIFNEHVGVRHNGIWYSNDYSFGYEFAQELELENEGYQAYMPKGGANFGLGHSSGWGDYEYNPFAKSAKKSAMALMKPAYHESSEAWQQYYQELYERGELEGSELDRIMASDWEADDLTERDDWDDYADRKCRV